MSKRNQLKTRPQTLKAYRLRLGKYFSRSGMPLAILFMRPQQNIDFHDHDFIELVVILEGCGRHITQGGQYAITAGDVFVIPKRIGHGYRDTHRLELVNVLFDLRQLALPLRELLPLDGYQALFVLEPRLRLAGGVHHYCRLSASELSRVQDLLTNIDRELTDKPPGYKCLALGLFLQVVGFICRCYAQIRAPAPRAILRLGRTLGFLEDHYPEQITLDQLAQIAHMSPSTLYRAFQRTFQTPPIEYLIRYRIHKAMELLTAGDLNVTEIALRAGFNDSNYFARQFHEHMGVTPSKYRQIHKKNFTKQI